MLRLTACALSLALAGTAAAQSVAPAAAPASTDALRDMMHNYVRSERMQVVPFSLSGASTITAGVLLLEQDDRGARAAAWPLLGFGAIELVAGAAFFVRSYSEEAKLDRLLATDPAEFTRHERARVRRITHLFQPILLGIEAAAVLAGGGLALGGLFGGSPDMLGVGIGLAIQALLFFALDWAVLDRAMGWSATLDRFAPG